ncbi:MAG: hypothetical protein LBK60_02390 [Verrucomicrobiales bacterium]|nr:hypothetical protein [Verrucomicrobiales bacterium]
MSIAGAVVGCLWSMQYSKWCGILGVIIGAYVGLVTGRIIPLLIYWLFVIYDRIMPRLREKLKKSRIIKMVKQMLMWRLFSRQEIPMSAVGIIAWWEIRRIPYNLIVGVTGILVVIMITLGAWACEARGGVPIGYCDPPFLMFFGIFIYAFMANVCYTVGWITELFIRACKGADNGIGRVLFFTGLLFSIALTVAPGILLGIMQILEIISLSRSHGC